MLTLQDVTAIKINDVDGLRAAGIDPAEVAIEFATVMFDQLFQDGFFHADPHPGNIFVTPAGSPIRGDAPTGRGAAGGRTASPPWTLTFIDFGMMGEVPDGAAARSAAAARSPPRRATARAWSTASARSACCCRPPTRPSSSGR